MNDEQFRANLRQRTLQRFEEQFGMDIHEGTLESLALGDHGIVLKENYAALAEADGDEEYYQAVRLALNLAIRRRLETGAEPLAPTGLRRIVAEAIAEERAKRQQEQS